MKWGKIINPFLPHPETHQKTRLLSWHYLVIYLLLFMLLRVGFDLISIYRPGILGVDSQISTQEIISKVNQERHQKGLPLLVENQLLNQAALAKAQNMLEENYWAHFSPSGGDPWKFILGAGYKFFYAGENLARNFYSADDAVKAWMASSSHRDNILNPNYQDIGIAVVKGNLQGQQTTLIVQMFGKPYGAVAVVPKVDLGGQKFEVKPEQVAQNINQSILVASSRIQDASLKSPPLLDPFMTMKIVGICLFLFMALLTVLDLVVLKKRGVFRLSSHHFAHLSFLMIAGTALLLSRAGEIL